jgi:hypothetical protein
MDVSTDNIRHLYLVSLYQEHYDGWFASIIKYNQRTPRVVSSVSTDTVDSPFSPDEGCVVSFRKTMVDRPMSPSTIQFPLKVTDIGRDSSVGIATRYGLECPGIESRWG